MLQFVDVVQPTTRKRSTGEEVDHIRGVRRKGVTFAKHYASVMIVNRQCRQVGGFWRRQFVRGWGRGG